MSNTKKRPRVYVVGGGLEYIKMLYAMAYDGAKGLDDADIVLFVYREDYYLAAKQPADDHPDFAKWQEDMTRAYGKAEVIVAKQRHGATGKVKLKFDSRITKFSDLADDAYLPEMRS